MYAQLHPVYSKIMKNYYADLCGGAARWVECTNCSPAPRKLNHNIYYNDEGNSLQYEKKSPHFSFITLQ